MSDLYEPVSDGTDNNVFISASYDPSSHFESVCHSVKHMYQRIMGKELVVTKRETVESP